MTLPIFVCLKPVTLAETMFVYFISTNAQELTLFIQLYELLQNLQFYKKLLKFQVLLSNVSFCQLKQVRLKIKLKTLWNSHQGYFSFIKLMYNFYNLTCFQYRRKPWLL